MAGAQGFRVLGTEDPLLLHQQQRGGLVTGPGRIPTSPVQRARLAREARVSGCSGPSTWPTLGVWPHAVRWVLVRGPGTASYGGRSSVCARPGPILGFSVTGPAACVEFAERGAEL
jgi:hypothetical protein